MVQYIGFHNNEEFNTGFLDFMAQNQSFNGVFLFLKERKRKKTGKMIHPIIELSVHK